MAEDTVARVEQGVEQVDWSIYGSYTTGKVRPASEGGMEEVLDSGAKMEK